MMAEHNPFWGQFKYALEILRESENSVAVQTTIRPDMVPMGAHACVYNAPTGLKWPVTMEMSINAIEPWRTNPHAYTFTHTHGHFIST